MRKQFGLLGRLVAAISLLLFFSRILSACPHGFNRPSFRSMLSGGAELALAMSILALLMVGFTGRITLVLAVVFPLKEKP